MVYQEKLVNHSDGFDGCGAFDSFVCGGLCLNGGVAFKFGCVGFGLLFLAVFGIGGIVDKDAYANVLGFAGSQCGGGVNDVGAARVANLSCKGCAGAFEIEHIGLIAHVAHGDGIVHDCAGSARAELGGR